MKENSKQTDAAELRRQAEMKLSERKKKAAPPPATEADTRRLVHDLQVHQIELEMQTEELLQSRVQVEAGLRQYTDLYDFAPAGYFTLARDGAIYQVNLAGANLLGVERGKLIKRRFGVFVSVESRSIFSAFLDKVFSTSGSKAACEIVLLKDGHEPLWAHIEATIEDGHECRAVALDITERKRAEDALQQSEERFRTLIENTSDLVIVLKPDGTSKYISPLVKRLLGYKPDEIVGQSITDFVHPDDLPAALQAIAIRVRTPGLADSASEFRVRHKDGSYRMMEVIGNNLLENPAVNGIVVNARDITERKRAEEALRESEEKYRTILENIEEGYFEVDIAGNFTFFNESVCRLLGYSREEMMGMNNRDYTDKMNAHKLYRTFNEVYRTGVPAQGSDWEVIRKDGTKRYVESSVSIRKNKSGQPIGFRGIVRDITERKQAVEELRKSEERFKLIFEYAPDAIYLNDLKGNFIAGNKAAEKITGFEKDELIGGSFLKLNLLSVDQLPKAVTLLAKNARGKPTGPDEFILKRKAGDKVLVEIITHPIKFEKRTVVLGIARDITERKRAEAQIRRRNIELAEINQIGQAFSRLRPPSEIVELLYTHLGQVLDNRNLYIALCDEEHQTLSFPVYTINGERHTPASRPFGNGLTEYVIRTGAPLLIPRNQPAFHAEQGIDIIGTPSKCFLAAPMRVGERVTGVIAVQDYENEDIYDANHKELIGTLAAQAAIALENARLYSAVQQELDERKRAEERIKAALEEKEALLREVHHRVKNNLQAMISLMDMHSSQIQDDGTRQFLRELEGQTRTMSLVYEQLYQSENLARVSMAPYFQKLASNVLEVFGGGRDIQLNLDIAPLSLDVAQAMPCGLIVNELLTNSLKYAFPPKYKGKPAILIALKQAKKTYKLTVSDNGVGLPPEMNMRTSGSLRPGSGKTLGLGLVDLWAVHQLGGKLEVVGKPGTVYSVSFAVE